MRPVVSALPVGLFFFARQLCLEPGHASLARASSRPPRPSSFPSSLYPRKPPVLVFPIGVGPSSAFPGVPIGSSGLGWRSRVPRCVGCSSRDCSPRRSPGCAPCGVAWSWGTLERDPDHALASHSRETQGAALSRRAFRRGGHGHLRRHSSPGGAGGAILVPVPSGRPRCLVSAVCVPCPVGAYFRPFRVPRRVN